MCESSTDESCGIFYIASSTGFFQEAKLSAKTVKNCMSEVPVAIGTVPELSNDVPDVFDKVVELDKVTSDFGDKVYNFDCSPFDKTIYLDTDIHVESNISEIFECLDKFDLAVAYNSTEYNFGSKPMPNNHPNTEVPDCVREFNTGVIAWKSGEQLNSFFDQWQEYYEYDKEHVEESPPDQVSFKRVLYDSDLRYLTLPREYNCLFRTAGYVHGPVKIFHGRLTDVDGHGAEYTMDIHRAIKNINSFSGARVYFTSPRSVVYSGENRFLNIGYKFYRKLVTILT